MKLKELPVSRIPAVPSVATGKLHYYAGRREYDNVYIQFDEPATDLIPKLTIGRYTFCDVIPLNKPDNDGYQECYIRYFQIEPHNENLLPKT